MKHFRVNHTDFFLKTIDIRTFYRQLNIRVKKNIKCNGINARQPKASLRCPRLRECAFCEKLYGHGFVNAGSMTACASLISNLFHGLFLVLAVRIRP